MVESISPILLNAFLMSNYLQVNPNPWYSDIVNYLMSGRIPMGWMKDKDEFFHLVIFFISDDPYLFKRCSH